MGRIYCPQPLIICKESFNKLFRSNIGVKKVANTFFATIHFIFAMLVYRDLTPSETRVEFLRIFLTSHFFNRVVDVIYVRWYLFNSLKDSFTIILKQFS